MSISKQVIKIWGYEEIVENNEFYCLKFLHLRQGYQCSMHYHKIKDETFYILNGTVKMEHNGKTFTMIKGDKIRVKPLDRHRFSGIEDSVIIEISTTDYEMDSYRIEKSRKIN